MKKLLIFTLLFALSSVMMLQAISKNKTRGFRGLPVDITAYRDFPKVNQTVLPPNPTTGHPGNKDVFINKTKAEVTDSDGNYIVPVEEGTIVVKESRKKEKTSPKHIAELTVMRKLAGHDETGGWEFTMFKKKKRQFMQMPIADPVSACFTCHQNAAANDFLFTKFSN